jgi:acetyl-CoA synthetase
MSFQTISKKAAAPPVRPNLLRYAETCQSFSWDEIRKELRGLPYNTGLNLAYEAVDSHGKGSRAQHTALRWISKSGGVRNFSYADLMGESSRFANLLDSLGLSKGDRVFALLGRIPELYTAALGTVKFGCVFCPLFSQFGPEPVFQRLSRGDAKVLVTTEAQFEKKIRPLLIRLPALRCVLLVDAAEDLENNVL